jgi:menaquinone-dependent protoporphyrinogen IX oxidase
MKGIIIYKGKYGATRQYAEWLSQSLELTAITPEGCEGKLAACDFVILGSSVYIGKLQIAKWLKDHLAEIGDKQVFLFIVCGTPGNETAKLESYVTSSVPAAIRSQCRIYFLPGRLVYKNLSVMDKFMLRMGALLSGEAKTKKAMLTDYDDVKRENLAALLKDARGFSEKKASMLQDA